MHKPLIAIAAALLASSASADTFIDNVNGIQIDANGKFERFAGILIGDDGKVKQVWVFGPKPTGATKVVDGRGRTMLPGLIDAHGHVMGLGQAALQLDLVGTTSIRDVQRRLSNYAAECKDPWLSGRGWNQELWSEKRFPTAADLDAAVSDRPVVLERVDGHAVVINSAALRAAKITAATKDPVGGKIERDGQGNPTGLLIDAATELVTKVVPPTTAQQLDAAFAKAQETLLSVGVTSAADMGTSIADWEAFRRAGDAGNLNVRVFSYSFRLEPLLAISPNGPTPWLYGDRLRMGGMKLYDDGALGSRGAWLKHSYSDKPDTHGLQFLKDKELRKTADEAAKRGYQIAIHAIGDAANAQVLATYEWLNQRYKGDRRWRIEHAQVVDPADIGRFNRAKVIASMQPTHQTSDRLMAEARLGPRRLSGAYAWQAMLKSGARIAFGSDFPVESPNPFPGLSAAISRQDLNGQPPGGWFPEQRLTFAQALKAFTRDAAYAGFADTKVGALEPGKWADLILIDRDPTKVDAQSLARTEVLETWVAGKKVWSREPSASPAGRDR